MGNTAAGIVENWYRDLFSSTSSHSSLLHSTKNKFQKRRWITVDPLSLFCLVQYFTGSYLTFPCKYFYTRAVRSALFHVTLTEKFNKTCTEIKLIVTDSVLSSILTSWKSDKYKELEMVWPVEKLKLMLTNGPDIFISHVLQISNP